MQKQMCLWREIVFGTRASCHSILRSICSKAGCRIDGKRPDMILPVAATHVAKSLFRGNNSKQNDDESDDDYENDDSDELSDDEGADVSISDEDVNDPISAAKEKMKETWHSLSPPKPEKGIGMGLYGKENVMKFCTLCKLSEDSLWIKTAQSIVF